MGEGPTHSNVLTLKRVIIVLALGGLLLAAGLIVVWLSRPSTLTLEVTQPVGKTVVCHAVVDGVARELEDIAPVTFRFEGHKLRYAIVSADRVPADVTVSSTDQSGSGGSRTAAGVEGEYSGNWWGSTWRFGQMSATHVKTMRTAVTKQRGETRENEGNEVPSP